MNKVSKTSDSSPEAGFAHQASRKRAGLPRELLAFLMANKKWWLLPIFVVLLAVMGLVLLGGTAVAPFIYTLF